ncbi:MAG: permease [Euryarchaeota archaeon]|nr:permease [Euryarchaeota archaeon]
MSPMKPSGRNVFLLVIAALYTALAAYDIALFMETLRAFVDLLGKVVPVMFLVFVMMFIVDLVVEPGTVKKRLGKGSGSVGWGVAVLGGVLSTGPIYVWYPLLEDLRKKGVKDSLIVAFLYARAVKIPMAPMMIYYFGWTFTAVLYMYIIVFSVLNGVLVERLLRDLVE